MSEKQIERKKNSFDYFVRVSADEDERIRLQPNCVLNLMLFIDVWKSNEFMFQISHRKLTLLTKLMRSHLTVNVFPLFLMVGHYLFLSLCSAHKFKKFKN